MPLLNAGRGRIIWVSSLEAYPWTYSPADMDGVKATHSYEGSKRLTDVMVLTGASAATRPWSDAFFASEKQDSDSPRRVRSYVCHPGICATSMVDLPAILWYCMTLAFFIARWLGSPWHTISTDSGANAPVHLALATDEELAETNAERVKWGSGSDRSGNGVLRKTEVDEEGGEEWEALGRDTWRQMEELRLLWKGRLEV